MDFLRDVIQWNRNVVKFSKVNELKTNFSIAVENLGKSFDSYDNATRIVNIFKRKNRIMLNKKNHVFQMMYRRGRVMSLYIVSCWPLFWKIKKNLHSISSDYSMVNLNQQQGRDRWFDSSGFTQPSIPCAVAGHNTTNNKGL